VSRYKRVLAASVMAAALVTVPVAPSVLASATSHATAPTATTTATANPDVLCATCWPS